MSKFLFLIQHQVGAYDTVSPDDMQTIVTRYRDWVKSLKDAGAYIASERLANDGRTLQGSRERLRISDGPYVESKDLVAGFYLVEARDYDHAVALAKECPVLERGILEVRRIATN